MSFMPWSDALKIGIATIDGQHRWLVDATNRLHDAIQHSAPDRVLLGGTLEGLVDYTMNHFVLEEELFLRFGYPESVAHKAEHDAFSKQAVALLLEFEKGKDVGSDALEMLKAWLLHHIMKVDFAYAPFLLSRGVK